MNRVNVRKEYARPKRGKTGFESKQEKCRKICRRKSIIAVDKEKVHCYNCLHEQRRSFYRKVTVESAPFFMLYEIIP